MEKPKIAIFDLTDCEGCELQFLSLKDRFLQFAEDYEIANWRLVQPMEGELPQVDVAIIQGTAVTQNDQEIVKKIRQNSKYLVALGECARTGWIPTWIKKEDRPKAFEKIYGPGYKPKAVDALPIKSLVDVDLELPGCPPDLKMIEDFLDNLPEKLEEKENAS